MIAFGFGSQEAMARDKIKRLLLGAAIKGESLFAVSDKWNAEREYKGVPVKDQPERYTLFWVYDKAIHYMHVNTRHPFSPDGMASLSVDEPLTDGVSKGVEG